MRAVFKIVDPYKDRNKTDRYGLCKIGCHTSEDDDYLDGVVFSFMMIK